MKNTLPAFVGLGAIALVLAGCAGPDVKHVDSDSSRTVLGVDKINMQDWNIAADDMIKKLMDEFINADKLQSADGPGKPSVLAISRIVNSTSAQFDNDMLIKRIRVALLQTGKVVVDITAGLGGAEDPLAEEAKRNNAFTGGKKLRRPDYTLSGKIIEDRTRAGKIQEANYFFQFSLATSDGLAVWEAEKRITKQGRRSSVGF